MNKLYQVVDQPATPLPQRDHQFLHTRQAGVEVPLLQSVMTAVIVGLAVLAMAFVLDLLDPWKPALVAAALGMAGWWLASLRRWTSLTASDQPTVEVRSVDHDDDPSTPNVIRVELSKVKENGHFEWNTFNLPEGVTNEMMTDLASGILNMHKPFTESEWSGPGKPFSRPKFYQLRALMENRKLIEPKNEKDARQGFRFNSDGEQFLQGFLA